MCRNQERRCADIVPTGRHYAGMFGPVYASGYLGNGQGIHVRTKRHNIIRRPLSMNVRHHTGISHRRVGDSQTVQLSLYKNRSLMFLKRKLWILVQMPPPFHGLFMDLVSEDMDLFFHHFTTPYWYT